MHVYATSSRRAGRDAGGRRVFYGARDAEDRRRTAKTRRRTSGFHDKPTTGVSRETRIPADGLRIATTVSPETIKNKKNRLESREDRILFTSDGFLPRKITGRARSVVFLPGRGGDFTFLRRRKRYDVNEGLRWRGDVDVRRTHSEHVERRTGEPAGRCG